MPDIKPKSGSPTPLLILERVVKSFGERRALDDVSLEIFEGKVTVLLGPSGCGKSTLLRCLNGLEQIQSGTIRLRNIPLPGPQGDWRLIRQQIGMVFQSYDLFPHLNVLENILLGPVRAQNRPRETVLPEAREWLRRVGLTDREEAYARELSGGQKQRVAIARALCLKPLVMLFDEVTASLDPEMVREVLDVIEELAAGGMTLVIVTHELGFARAVADQIVFMDAGRIVELAEPEIFFSRPQSERARRFLDQFNFVSRRRTS